MIKIKILMENTTIDKKIRPKHGLSVFIDNEESKILLDVGPDKTFIKNAETMNVDLKNIDYLVLSHSHIDHTGGLNYFEKINSKADIILMDDIRNKYYTKILNWFMISIGLKINKKVTKRIKKINEPLKIDSKTWFIKNENDIFFKSSLNRVLYKAEERIIIEDSFKHEGILVINDNDELVIFSACSHNGVGNIIETVKKKFPDKKIRSFIGGLHLYNPITKENEKDVNLERIVNEIKNMDIRFYTGHCTGEYAFQYLKKHLKNKLERISSGMEILV